MREAGSRGWEAQWEVSATCDSPPLYVSWGRLNTEAKSPSNGNPSKNSGERMPCSSYLLESGTVRRGNRLRKGEDSSEVTGSSLGRKDNVRRGLKKKHSGNEQSLALCGMKSQVGKGRAATPPPGTTWSWPCPSSVSPRFQDAPLMLTSGSAHPTLRKLRLRDSCDKAWGVG